MVSDNIRQKLRCLGIGQREPVMSSYVGGDGEESISNQLVNAVINPHPVDAAIPAVDDECRAFRAHCTGAPLTGANGGSNVAARLRVKKSFDRKEAETLKEIGFRH